jgi:hypothetical protein
MPTCFYIAEVIGTGTLRDRYRPACAEVWKDYSCAIPVDDKGIPLSNTCLVKVTDKDQSNVPKGLVKLPRCEEFVAEAEIREEMRKAGQKIETAEFIEATARIVDQVKEVGGEFATYELKQLEEMLGVDKK